MVKSILVRSNPWRHVECGRQKCIPCSQTDKESASGCSTRNVVYESSCSECKLKGSKVRYIGETARSLMERAAEHIRDSSNKDKLSHMRTHWDEFHPGRKTEFKFRILRQCRSSFERELSEAIMIKTARDGLLLNNKEEFNRCVIPELTMRKGNKVVDDVEVEKKEQEVRRSVKRAPDSSTPVGNVGPIPDGQSWSL